MVLHDCFYPLVLSRSKCPSSLYLPLLFFFENMVFRFEILASPFFFKFSSLSRGVVFPLFVRPAHKVELSTSSPVCPMLSFLLSPFPPALRQSLHGKPLENPDYLSPFTLQYGQTRRPLLFLNNPFSPRHLVFLFFSLPFSCGSEPLSFVASGPAPSLSDFKKRRTEAVVFEAAPCFLSPAPSLCISPCGFFLHTQGRAT